MADTDRVHIFNMYDVDFNYVTTIMIIFLLENIILFSIKQFKYVWQVIYIKRFLILILFILVYYFK